MKEIAFVFGWAIRISMVSILPFAAALIGQSARSCKLEDWKEKQLRHKSSMAMFVGCVHVSSFGNQALN
jgi:hypothetical protein